MGQDDAPFDETYAGVSVRRRTVRAPPRADGLRPPQQRTTILLDEPRRRRATSARVQAAHRISHRTHPQLGHARVRRVVSVASPSVEPITRGGSANLIPPRRGLGPVPTPRRSQQCATRAAPAPGCSRSCSRQTSGGKLLLSLRWSRSSLTPPRRSHRSGATVLAPMAVRRPRGP